MSYTMAEKNPVIHVQHDHAEIHFFMEFLSNRIYIFFENKDEGSYIRLIDAWRSFREVFTAHLSKEEERVFKPVLRAFPELVPTITYIIEEHAVLTDILNEIERIILRPYDLLIFEESVLLNMWSSFSKNIHEHTRIENDLFLKVKGHFQNFFDTNG